MEHYIRMLIEEEIDLDALKSALRDRIRDELDYDYFAKLILENFDIEEIAQDFIEDNLSLPF